MNAQITQQTRENAAQQFRQWALAKNVSLAQTEQMVAALLSGQHDAQIVRAAQPSGSGHQQQQHHDFVHMFPNFGFQTPFGTFPLPTMPPPPIPMASGMYPPPAMAVPNMFPTHGVQVNQQVPNVQTTRTTFPGGEAVQQSSSYSGQQGNTSFQYSSSSTSMNFSPPTQLPVQAVPLPSMQYVQQPTLPALSHLPLASAPAHIAPPIQQQPQPQSQSQPQPQPQPQPQRPLKPHPQPVPVPVPVQAPIVQVAPEPEQIFHPTTANQAPQNSRLAETFKRELSEATYFSDIPGMPDRSVQK